MCSCGARGEGAAQSVGEEKDGDGEESVLWCFELIQGDLGPLQSRRPCIPTFLSGAAHCPLPP